MCAFFKNLGFFLQGSYFGLIFLRLVSEWLWLSLYSGINFALLHVTFWSVHFYGVAS